jgi:hypothetical protein
MLQFLRAATYILASILIMLAIPIALVLMVFAAGIVLILDWCKPRPRKKWIPPMGGA